MRQNNAWCVIDDDIAWISSNTLLKPPFPKSAVGVGNHYAISHSLTNVELLDAFTLMLFPSYKKLFFFQTENFFYDKKNIFAENFSGKGKISKQKENFRAKRDFLAKKGWICVTIRELSRKRRIFVTKREFSEKGIKKLFFGQREIFYRFSISVVVPSR